MASYKPSVPFNVPAFILTPQKEEIINGVTVKTYKKPEELTKEDMLFCSFRTFGGTETTVNGIYAVENTATVETWYDPQITAECRMVVDGSIYEIKGTPENINMQNQYLKFRVIAIEGGA